MNVINTYLDTMFGAYPQSGRMLEAKAELRAMMEDAYTSMIAEGRSENEAIGQVIRDFGNIDELAPVLGISTDIDPASGDIGQGPTSAPIAHLPVTLEEAQLYADAHERTRFRLSAAVILFVLSPVALIFLPVASRSGLLPFTERTTPLTGILILLVFAAIGALTFISAARTNATPKRIAEGNFSINPVVTRWAEALAQRHNHRRIRALQIATLLSILSSLPLIGFTLFLGSSSQGELWITLGIVIVLAVVAVALGILLPQAWAHTVADKLTRGAHGRKKTATARQ